MKTPNRGGPRLLATDRESAVYLERAKIRVRGNRIVYHIVDDSHYRKYSIPHVNLAVLFIGQGTSITQNAMRLLSEEGVHLAVTGTGGTPLHMGALTTYKSTGHFRSFLPIYQSSELSLKAGKAVMQDRCARMRKVGVKLAGQFMKTRKTKGLDTICRRLEVRLEQVKDIQELLGEEGNFSRSCYAEFAKMAGLSGFRRSPGGGADDETVKLGDAVRKANRLIDHGNYLSYGMAGAALWFLGIPPHMAVFHGKTRAGGLVFDLADSFKDAFVLPLAFASQSSAKGTEEDPEKVFRARMIDAFNDYRILKEAIATVNNMIAVGRLDA